MYCDLYRKGVRVRFVKTYRTTYIVCRASPDTPAMLGTDLYVHILSFKFIYLTWVVFVFFYIFIDIQGKVFLLGKRL